MTKSIKTMNKWKLHVGFVRNRIANELIVKRGHFVLLWSFFNKQKWCKRRQWKQRPRNKHGISTYSLRSSTDILTFGARPKAEEKKQVPSPGVPGIQIKVKPKKVSKKKKAEKPAGLNLLSYGEDSLPVSNKHILNSSHLLESHFVEELHHS